eukprot:jgi/Chlat1/601/Chrsp103S00951
MALEAYLALVGLMVEFVALGVLSAPAPAPLRRRLIQWTGSLLRMFAAVLPFVFFLLADAVLKYERGPGLSGKDPSPAAAGPYAMNPDRVAQKTYKAQRNILLYGGILGMYWLLYRYRATLIKLDELAMELKHVQTTQLHAEAPDAAPISPPNAKLPEMPSAPPALEETVPLTSKPKTL